MAAIVNPPTPNRSDQLRSGRFLPATRLMIPHVTICMNGNHVLPFETTGVPNTLPQVVTSSVGSSMTIFFTHTSIYLPPGIGPDRCVSFRVPPACWQSCCQPSEPVLFCLDFLLQRLCHAQVLLVHSFPCLLVFHPLECISDFSLLCLRDDPLCHREQNIVLLHDVLA